MMLFRRRDVPLDGDASGRFLPWLVAIMVYLAALALISALTMNRAISHWQDGLSGTLTIQIPQENSAKKTPAAPDALDRILTVLIATPGIIEAKVMEPEEIERLLQPWLGAAASLAELPVPTLVSVTFNPTAEPDFSELARAVAKISPDAIVDTHQAWLGKVRDLARTVQAVAILVVALIIGSAIMIIAFATRMGLSVHGHVIELLHLIGARDSYVASQFQAHVLTFALRGGIIGLVLAVATVFLAGRTLEGSDVLLLPDLVLQPLDWSVLLLLPVAVALVATITARFTVLRTLARMA